MQLRHALTTGTWPACTLPAAIDGPGATRLLRSELSGSGHFEGMQHLNSRIGEAGGARFWFHALRNCFISVADRDLMLLPASLTERLVNHARPQDVTEGYAADWTMEQLRDAAQRIADTIDEFIRARGPCGL